MRRDRWNPLRAGMLVLAAGLLAGGLPAPALAAPVPESLIATLDGNNVPTDGDPGGTGTFTIALDGTLEQACFTLDLTLTDLAGDPPTVIDVHDGGTGDPGTVVLDLAAGTDVAGHAEGCVAATPAVISAMLSAPTDYIVDVHTAAFPDGVVRGTLDYAYPRGLLSVSTRLCPAGIQSVAQLDAIAKASCLVVVLPPDDILPSIPAGYTVTGYGGTATFDYHVTDGRHLDATIAGGSREGGGTCDDSTMTCNFSFLPYEWIAGLGGLHVTPTVLPAGTRFGSAEAADGADPGAPLPLQVGAGNELTVDASGVTAASVVVYLFRTADATAPDVSTPTVTLRSGGILGSSAPIHLAWTGSDAGSGIARYVVLRSVDGKAWTTLNAAVTGTTYNTTLVAGHGYRFRVRAYDNAGHNRTSGATPTQRLRVVQDTSASVHYAGTWHSASASTASAGRVHYATATWATAGLTFTGRSIAWVSPTSLGRGFATVYLDGKYAATVNLHVTSAVRVVVFAKRFSSVGTHRITVKVAGTPGHPRVDVDVFLYLN